MIKQVRPHEYLLMMAYDSANTIFHSFYRLGLVSIYTWTLTNKALLIFLPIFALLLQDLSFKLQKY
jgi:hypothetical protein